MNIDKEVVTIPKISIVIPTYNRADFILETIQSVFEQSFTDFEILVVDDGSTDKTREVLAKYIDEPRFRSHFFEKNQGRSAARNYGMENAAGDYLMFLDSDDLLAPQALQVLFDLAAKFPESEVVAGGRNYIDNENKVLNLVDELAIKREISNEQVILGKVRTIYFCMGSYIIKSDLARRLKGFDVLQEPCEDFDFFIRYCDVARISAVKTPVVFIRRHDGNTVPTRIFDTLIKIAEQNFDSLKNNPQNYPSGLLKQIKVEWQLKMANDFYNIGDNKRAFEHYLTAIKIEPKLLLDKKVVKSTLMTNLSPKLREKLKTKLRI